MSYNIIRLKTGSQCIQSIVFGFGFYGNKQVILLSGMVLSGTHGDAHLNTTISWQLTKDWLLPNGVQYVSHFNFVAVRTV